MVAPVNDLFANATVVEVSNNPFVSVTTDLTDATLETNEPIKPATWNLKNTAWWKYTPLASGTATIDTQLTTAASASYSRDTEMGVYTGTSVSTLTKVAGDSDTGGNYTSIVSNLAVTGGTTYYIQVGAYASLSVPVNSAVLRITGAPTTNNQTISVGQPSETTTANVMTVAVAQTVVLTEPAETDTANVMTVAVDQTKTIGQASETDTANVMAVALPQTISLGQSSETSTSNVMTAAVAQTVVLGQAADLSSANAFTAQINATLTGSTGSFTLYGFSPSLLAVYTYTPAVDGSLVMQVTSPTGWKPTFTVTDTDGSVVQVDTDGTLSLVWVAGQPLTIAISQVGQTTSDVAFSWTYAARASSALVVDLERDYVYQTPGGLEVTVANGAPNEVVSLSLVGVNVIANFQTITLDGYGSYPDAMVYLPTVEAGSYYLRVEGTTSGAEDVPFTIQHDALYTDGGAKPVDPRPVTTPALHWRFYDLRDSETTYTMVRNPKSWTNMFPPNDFTHDKTTAPDGADLTWQAAARPWRMEFSGYFDTQAEHDALLFWSQLRRRFWLIDHRNRAWLMVIEQFDAQAQIKPNKPWAHEYTMRTLVFMQGAN